MGSCRAGETWKICIAMRENPYQAMTAKKSMDRSVPATTAAERTLPGKRSRNSVTEMCSPRL